MIGHVVEAMHYAIVNDPRLELTLSTPDWFHRAWFDATRVRHLDSPQQNDLDGMEITCHIRSRKQGLKQHFSSLMLANMTDCEVRVAVMQMARKLSAVATVATKHVA